MFLIRRLFSSPTLSQAMADAKTKAQGIIDENAVAVFSKSYCPYCSASKRLLDSLGAKYKLVELDEVPDGSEIQNALAEISGQRTVPNIWIGKKHIGGNSDLQAKSGELKDLLSEAGAL
ncbi:putative glutaredoxin [Annulohypoxylon truncatum]|uniref:putative glutaredoxin n=1 Tax=Annulohypoxylon truncatum TaxID=327061 RepID=UPI0020081314|nr:putative glutaredoxin [Annulohypoxylon truncatum]KAI1206372.1 putative glutaredoxin [Annulohypoxylon truncatum]